MKANELRIGNWVESFGKLIQISMDDFVCQEFKENEYVFEDFQPIQLTSEWLNKFSSDGHYIFLNDGKGGAIDFSDIDNIYLVNEWFENFPLNKIQ